MSPPEPPPPPAGIPEENWFKNRLQQYTHGACIPLPVYETVSEGFQHAPKFRSRVWVDGTCFSSPNSFSNKKASEQDVAKHALIGIREKVKIEGPTHILENVVFCKSIINEYALKMNMNLPTYVTNESKALHPVFVSSMVLDGVTFVGLAARNKKEAEQFAARSAILSILETESCTAMSELVKSKFRFYDALKTIKNSADVPTIPPNEPNSSIQIDNERDEVNSLEDKRKTCNELVVYVGMNRVENINDSSNVHTTPPEPTVENLNDSSGVPLEDIAVNKRKRVDCGTIFDSQTLPINETKEAHVTTSSEVMHLESSMEPSRTQALSPEIAPSIVFVPPLSEQALTCSTSRKNKRRRKKSGKNKVQHQSP